MATQNTVPETNTTTEAKVAKPYDYGGNPQFSAHNDGGRLAAFGGEFQPGLYRPIENRKFANPAPLGLCGFALTTFVLSLVNLQARDVTSPNIVLSLAYAYGGLCQLLAGMWEMAVGNTFGATALSSYGGFWIAYGIALTPAFDALSQYSAKDEASALGFFLIGWFIFTFILVLCSIKSTVMFSLLFIWLDLAFLFLALAEFVAANGHPKISLGLQKAGGVFGILSAFWAWYNAFAGIADTSNSFFIAPVIHLPWSEKAREGRAKTERETV
ncbi:GPR1/FUN34/yaaH family-domain-containing protein [Xylariaceae sp. FL0255]|nr:GPR1/FUN34/yaaH family-domain-containing protein [Xylariaceae sp. FL0255]